MRVEILCGQLALLMLTRILDTLGTADYMIHFSSMLIVPQNLSSRKYEYLEKAVRSSFLSVW
jgi:hypothetical protein